MKRCILATFLILGLWLSSAQATIYVPSYGETGWQTFSHTFSTNFTGDVYIVVGNYDDADLDSVLLIDNINPGPIGNESFELGDFTSYSTAGWCEVVTSAASYAGNNYSPTHGTYMAKLTAGDVDTSAYGGTDGAILSNATPGEVQFDAGDTWSFDWAFLAMDYSPYQDFAKLRLVDLSGQIYLDETLAQIDPVPIPGAVWLLGSGLVGLAALARRRLNK